MANNEISETNDTVLPTYEAPKIEVLDASETAGGAFVSPTEGPYSTTS